MVDNAYLLITALFILGLCAGSFVNALVWRVHKQSSKNGRKHSAKKTTNYQLPTTNYSILSGRSVCPNCRHQLSAKELIPLFSWLWLKGRCRHCKKPISAQYPVVELAMGLVFIASYIFWPVEIKGLGETALFVSWLLASVGLLALAVYDYRWMLLPNRILYPTAAVAIAGRLLFVVSSGEPKPALLDWVLTVAVASGIFWLIFHASKGKWIGYGDVRLGLITGSVLSSPLEAFLMIFTASVLGTIFVLPAMISGRQKATARIPYGPFLIAATFVVLLFGQKAIDWYKNLLV